MAHYSIVSTENNKQKFLELLMDERKRMINTLRDTYFTQLDKTICHKQIIPVASYSPWETGTEFMAVYNVAKNSTRMDIYRIYELWDVVKRAAGLDGDVLEVGVWRGGSGAILGAANKKATKSTVYLADTFKGVVKAGKKDTVFRGGEFSDTSEVIVKDLMKKAGVTKYKILKGIFPDDFTGKINIQKIKVCHIDVDTFESAKGVFEYVWPRMVSKGIVLFDDYSDWGCEGVTKYVNSLKPKDGVFIHNLNGHGLMIKI